MSIASGYLCAGTAPNLSSTGVESKQAAQCSSSVTPEAAKEYFDAHPNHRAHPGNIIQAKRVEPSQLPASENRWISSGSHHRFYIGRGH